MTTEFKAPSPESLLQGIRRSWGLFFFNKDLLLMGILKQMVLSSHSEKPCGTK
jgi:hypothetical protein